MNVNPNKILDLAEKEILTEALQSLSSQEFGRMIDGGDINFSSCRLTSTGREYAEKKSKIFAKNPLAAVPRCDIPVIGSQYCMNFPENMSDEKVLDTVDWRKILNGDLTKFSKFINTI